MTEQENTSRLAHFLKGYQQITPKLETVIYDRVHRAGFSPDEPMSMVLAHHTIIEANMLEHVEQLNKLPPRIAKKLQESFDQVQDKHVQALAAEKSVIAKRVAEETGAAVREEMPRLVRQFHWRVAAHLMVTFLVAAVLIAGVAHVSGRSVTSSIAAEQAEFAPRPDAATWNRLQRVNPNIDNTIAKNCRLGQEHYVPNGTLRGACNIPLNLDGQTVPAPVGLAGQVQEQLITTRAKMSFEAILLLGMIIGIGLLYIGRVIYDLIFDR